MQTPTDAASGPLPDPIIHDFAPVARTLLACKDRREFLRGKDAAAVERRIEEAIETEGARVLSLDVFDTFLLRNDKSEARRFGEIAARARRRVVADLSISEDAAATDADVLVARTDAMAQCYRTRAAVEGCREGRIADIVRATRRALAWPVEADAILLEEELAYESENLTLNPVLRDIASAFRADGGKVVLVSDMYLGKEAIDTILKNLGGAPEFDEIFSSADHVVSKRSGKIFRLIEEKLDTPPEEVLHIGDALDADVFAPRRAGWKALHFPIAYAETAARAADLDRFIAEMDAAGHDVARWAKV